MKTLSGMLQGANAQLAAALEELRRADMALGGDGKQPLHPLDLQIRKILIKKDDDHAAALREVMKVRKKKAKKAAKRTRRKA